MQEFLRSHIKVLKPPENQYIYPYQPCFAVCVDRSPKILREGKGRKLYVQYFTKIIVYHLFSMQHFNSTNVFTTNERNKKEY
jgi:hypothetical protein